MQPANSAAAAMTTPSPSAVRREVFICLLQRLTSSFNAVEALIADDGAVPLRKVHECGPAGFDRHPARN